MADKPLTEKEKNLQQVPIRLHMNDYRALKKLFIDEGWSFQKFVSASVEMYLRRDPLFLKTISDWKAENDMPKKQKDRFSHSRREQSALLDEIEEANEE
jgi:hypothetical protein